MPISQDYSQVYAPQLYTNPFLSNGNQSFLNDRNALRGYIANGMANSNGVAPQLSAGPQDQVRAAQMAQIAQLQGIASGQQQGAGELAAQRQANNAAAAQQAMARMARGSNAALAARTAANQTANIGLAGAGQAQQAALQDQANAQGLLTGAMNNTRGQDLSLAGQNANLAQQQYGLNTARQGTYLNALGGLTNAGLGYQGQTDVAQMQAKSQQLGGMMNGIGGMAALAMMSDERTKTDIEDADGDIDDMLDGLRAYNYRYKEPEKYGEGKRAGVMAQDLAKTKAGRAIVMDTPSGKMLDMGKSISASLAGLARLNERLRALEEV